MLRTIINIDKEKCNGCGICVNACHEGALAMVDGKARLVRDDYCDGLGNCLPACPTGAITFTEREAAAYDEAAVEENMKKKQDAATQHQHHDIPCGCPGSQSRTLKGETEQKMHRLLHRQGIWNHNCVNGRFKSNLHLSIAPYFDGSNLLIAADCSAYAYADFHNQFIKTESRSSVSKAGRR